MPALIGGLGAHLVAAGEDGAGRLVYLCELGAHALVLGALTCEKNGYLTHVEAPPSTRSASAMRSFTISAAVCSLFTRAAI